MRATSPIFSCRKHRGFLFVHSSQQREERTKKRCRCYRACSLGRCCRRRGLRNSLRSDSPRPGSSVGRRPAGPIKAVFPTGNACRFLNPSGYATSPIFCFAKHRGFLFVHSSQQREERTKKRCRCYRACSLGRCCRRRGLRNSLRSDSPRPISSAGRRPLGPIKAVSPAGNACRFLNPSVTACHLPYILLRKTQGRSLNASPPLYSFYGESIGEEGDG